MHHLLSPGDPPNASNATSLGRCLQHSSERPGNSTGSELPTQGFGELPEVPGAGLESEVYVLQGFRHGITPAKWPPWHMGQFPGVVGTGRPPLLRHAALRVGRIVRHACDFHVRIETPALGYGLAPGALKWLSPSNHNSFRTAC